jgi:hypothetical protein
MMAIGVTAIKARTTIVRTIAATATAHDMMTAGPTAMTRATAAKAIAPRATIGAPPMSTATTTATTAIAHRATTGVPPTAMTATIVAKPIARRITTAAPYTMTTPAIAVTSNGRMAADMIAATAAATGRFTPAHTTRPPMRNARTTPPMMRVTAAQAMAANT